MMTDNCEGVLKRPLGEGMGELRDRGGGALKMTRVRAIAASWNEKDNHDDLH